MPFTGIATPEQLAFLRSAVDDYCGVRGIVESARREDVAAVVLTLYSTGADTPDAILAGLDTSPVVKTF